MLALNVGSQYPGRGRGRGRGDGGNRVHKHDGINRYHGGFRGGRGGGGGFRDGDMRECRERESWAVSAAQANARTLARVPVPVETNCFPIDLSEGRFHNYIVSFEFLENATDMAGDMWKISLQNELLRTIRKNRTAEKRTRTSAEVEDLCVCTGQAILAPAKLSVEDGFSIECTRKEKVSRDNTEERHYRVRIRYDGEVSLKLPEHAQWVNKIIAFGLADTYSEHIGSDYVDMKSTVERGGDLVTMDAISLNALRIVKQSGSTTAMMDVLQLDVSTKASTKTKCSDEIRRLRQQNPQGFRRAVNEALVGISVTTVFGEPTFLKVKAIDFNILASSPTMFKTNPEETFVEYFKRKYDAIIDPTLPMLYCVFADRTKMSRRMPYPADSLLLNKLNEAQLSKLPILCSIYPNERIKRIKAALERVLASPLMITVLQQYGVRIQPQFVKVSGRVLPAPTIYVPSGPNMFNRINTAEYTGQAGFALGLKDLQHPSQPCEFKTLLMDEYFMHGNITHWLQKYNVALPSPRKTSFDSAAQRITEGSGTFAMVKLRTKEAGAYNNFKERFARGSIVSQMAVVDLTRNVPQMITQQVAAKIGQLCFVADVDEAGKSFACRPLLIVGAVVGTAMNTMLEKYKSINVRLYTITFVAFLANGKSWKPYCMHHQVKGEEHVLYEDSDAASSHMSSTTLTVRRQNANEVLNNRFPDFLKEVTAHFKLDGKGSKGTMVLYRGAMTDAEVGFTANMDLVMEQVLPNWDTATVVVHPRSHFRMAWDPTAVFPRETASAYAGFSNVPRGFSTTDCRIILADSDPYTPVDSFYLSAANCTLGHATNTYYLVQKRAASISLMDLQKLTYNMCYMYPNKPDALPLPLPIKCAYEYARKYGSLKSVKELPTRMRPTMHYL
ncbi:argonaute/dicer protein-like protein [Leishmania panamensis]|uniref:Argonaute/dicer protein-like protein, putative n=1 Tax=Leishmania panamensis TaxID=5679 RepID=A0A088RKB9_LEIPA|nr:argonaute/dicer protein-like protein [Leishmania panamensis]AIN96255.1 argonaute/dicer protein-like protein [Leishmania panamensis]